jgi:hypothetical protein
LGKNSSQFEGTDFQLGLTLNVPRNLLNQELSQQKPALIPGAPIFKKFHAIDIFCETLGLTHVANSQQSVVFAGAAYPRSLRISSIGLLGDLLKKLNVILDKQLRLQQTNAASNSVRYTIQTGGSSNGLICKELVMSLA